LKKVKWMQHLSGRILKHSMADRFVTAYTESLAVIPVSLSATPDSEKEQKTPDTFSRIYANTFVQLDLFGASLKTSEDTSIWDSTKFTKAFEIWVTKLRQDCLQRQRSARHTRENGSLFSQVTGRADIWSTPTATMSKRSDEVQDSGRGVQPAEWEGLKDWKNWLTPKVRDFRGVENHIIRNGGKNIRKTGEQFSVGLPTQAYMEDMKMNWPTPKCQNANSPAKHGQGGMDLQTKVENWETPTVSRGGHTQKDGKIKPKLDQQVKNWPTPRTSDDSQFSQSRINRAEAGTMDKGKLQLREVAVQHGQPDQDRSSTTGKNRGQLNPAWVEQLMGLTAGWTNFDCLETE